MHPNFPFQAAIRYWLWQAVECIEAGRHHVSVGIFELLRPEGTREVDGGRGSGCFAGYSGWD